MNCTDCGQPVEYWQVNCRCGQFLGFPNRRKAEEERDILRQRYLDAESAADSQGATHLGPRLQEFAEQARPVIAMPIVVCDDLLRGAKYRNYETRIANRERSPAKEDDHAEREMVAGRLFPGYGQHIVYAVLSTDGWGLRSYGQVAVRWQVVEKYLERRISLLEDNSFTFYDKHGLGPRGVQPPQGYRSVWADRHLLAGAKILPKLSASTPEAALEGMFLTDAGNRRDDEFMEAAIYADGGLDAEDADMVTLLKAPAIPAERDRWELVKEMCAGKSPKVVVVE